MSLPILYSYRRCPYAMRARMALRYSGIEVEAREILLRQKPKHMRDISPKGTVPVLQLPNSQVIDESLDIMHWALAQYDPQQWLAGDAELTSALIEESDGGFKRVLDKYKYAIRFPEKPAGAYRAEGEVFLQKLERLLASQAYLCGARCSLADIAIFPFIRQFAAVDAAWFAQAPYPALQAWLQKLVDSELFSAIMQKVEPWTEAA